MRPSAPTIRRQLRRGVRTLNLCQTKPSRNRTRNNSIQGFLPAIKSKDEGRNGEPDIRLGESVHTARGYWRSSDRDCALVLGARPGSIKQGTGSLRRQRPCEVCPPARPLDRKLPGMCSFLQGESATLSLTDEADRSMNPIFRYRWSSKLQKHFAPPRLPC
jgi:hypothetical protein